MFLVFPMYVIAVAITAGITRLLESPSEDMVNPAITDPMTLPWWVTLVVQCLRTAIAEELVYRAFLGTLFVVRYGTLMAALVIRLVRVYFSRGLE